MLSKLNNFNKVESVTDIKDHPAKQSEITAIYFILSSEINDYQKWIKVIFSLQN